MRLRHKTALAHEVALAKLVYADMQLLHKADIAAVMSTCGFGIKLRHAALA